MSDNPEPMSQIFRGPSPSRTHAIKLSIATVVVGSLLGLAGLTLTGTMMAVVIATPVFVLLLPIIIPTIAVLALVTTGFMFSGGCLAAALAVVAWIYNYVKQTGRIIEK